MLKPCILFHQMMKPHHHLFIFLMWIFLLHPAIQHALLHNALPNALPQNTIPNIYPHAWPHNTPSCSSSTTPQLHALPPPQLHALPQQHLNNTSTSRPSTLSPTATLLAKGCVFPLLHFAPSSTASSDTGPKPPLHALHSLLHPFTPLGRQGTLTMSRNSTSLLQPTR